MLISVIVPIYNREQYLTNCIESILSQSFADIELLLIDDGSTDNSGKICDEYATKDHRVRVLHKENGGVSCARNLGLDKAQGDYIHFVDADDIVLQRAYQYIAEVCRNYYPDIICFDNLTDAKDQNAVIMDDGEYYGSVHHFAEKNYIKVPVWLKVIKRAYIEKANTRFDAIIYSEDTVFIWELLQTDGTIYDTKSRFYSYTTNTNSAENNRDIAHIKKTIESLTTSNCKLKKIAKTFSNCPSVISNFTHKYEVLFNRILCTPYTYKELKPLFCRCAEIGTSHLAKGREIKTYDFLYRHPLFYYIFQSIIRRVYFQRHKIERGSGDFINGLLKPNKK